VLVVKSGNSSNSRRLVDVAGRREGRRNWLSLASIDTDRLCGSHPDPRPILFFAACVVGWSDLPDLRKFGSSNRGVV
jgi:hypothetical protein